MTKQLSITLDEALDAEIRAAAGGNISEWMAAARERLARQMWERYKSTADARWVSTIRAGWPPRSLLVSRRVRQG